MSAAPQDLKLADLSLLRKRKVKKRTKRSTLNSAGAADNDNVRRQESSQQSIGGKYFRSSKYLSKINRPPVHIYVV